MTWCAVIRAFIKLRWKRKLLCWPARARFGISCPNGSRWKSGLPRKKYLKSSLRQSNETKKAVLRREQITLNNSLFVMLYKSANSAPQPQFAPGPGIHYKYSRRQSNRSQKSKISFADPQIPPDRNSPPAVRSARRQTRLRRRPR